MALRIVAVTTPTITQYNNDKWYAEYRNLEANIAECHSADFLILKE
jgi:hypothetical protein